MSDHQRLEHLPVTIFASVMGLTGLALAWQKLQAVTKVDLGVNGILAGLALGVFIVLVLFYGLKALRYPSAVKAELRHPVKLSFFPTISISMILLATVFMHLAPSFAHLLWWIGIVLQFSLLMFVMNSWFNHEHFETAHVNPSWFIPAVGNVLVPVAGVHFGHMEISWFFFSVGIVLWVVLLTIVFNRVLFHNPMPAKLVPTLAILIAPPSVGFVAYFKLAGGLDKFCHVLYFSGLFFTFFVALQLPKFFKLPFFLSWWAYTFPLAAITIASLIMYSVTQVAGYAYLSYVLIGVLSLVVAFLIYRTLLAVARKQICLPE